MKLFEKKEKIFLRRGSDSADTQGGLKSFFVDSHPALAAVEFESEKFAVVPQKEGIGRANAVDGERREGGRREGGGALTGGGVGGARASEKARSKFVAEAVAGSHEGATVVVVGLLEAMLEGDNSMMSVEGFGLVVDDVGPVVELGGKIRGVVADHGGVGWTEVPYTTFDEVGDGLAPQLIEGGGGEEVAPCGAVVDMERPKLSVAQFDELPLYLFGGADGVVGRVVRSGDGGCGLYAVGVAEGKHKSVGGGIEGECALYLAGGGVAL